ncbi:MAG: glycoside hydrolase 100 family protein [Gammaproteobacteria bacterium]|nr:glycoside hydrolase 100 family protein [Gammaproteobacteria bacterium]
MSTEVLDSSRKILEHSIMYYQGRPVGTLAALPSSKLAAENYAECFIRDFVPSALVFLIQGRSNIVKNFLETVLTLKTSERVIAGHEIQPGVMPASFRVEVEKNGREKLVADFGERAIGRVAPVDSMMWWIILLDIYTKSTGDIELVSRPEFQRTMEQILHLCLKDSFEVSPALLVPDACSMIDRRMGIYGHPLEIQSLFYGVLKIIQNLYKEPKEYSKNNFSLLHTAKIREQALLNYVRIFYWLDLKRLNEIHRYRTEEFGLDSTNVLNIHPESIPNWVVNWLPHNSGYLVGNVSAGRMDFRFFALGNILSILFNLSTDEQSDKILNLYESKWNDLIGDMPVKIIYPAMEGLEWEIRTGSDPKNVPWSYQNGGNWPALLWTFVAAAIKSGRQDIAEHAYQTALKRLMEDNWPEYYDGHSGRLIGRRSNFRQVWTATSVILSHHFLEDPALLKLLPNS